MTAKETKMYEWNVYVNGKFIGTVNETCESSAICGAHAKFDIDDDARVSVSKR